MRRRGFLASLGCAALGGTLGVPLLPRELGGVGISLRPIDHWAETVLGLLLAIGVGLALRLVGASG